MGDSKITVELPAEVWSRIVFAAKDSDDWRLRTLIEQATMEARVPARVPASSISPFTGLPRTSSATGGTHDWSTS